MKHLKNTFLLLVSLLYIGDVSAAIVCPPGTGYFTARSVAKDEFAKLSDEDLKKILVENDPNLESLGACMEALNLVDKISGLFSPSVYVNYAGIQAILEFIKQQVIEAICTEILEEAQESFGIIADVIPSGMYLISVEGVGSVNTNF